MKQILQMTLGVMIFMFVACSKSSAPSPNTQDNNNGGTTPAKPKVIIDSISNTGGNASFNKENKFTGALFSDGIGNVIQTYIGGTDITALVHGDIGVLTKMKGGWRATFVSSTDTSKQVYFQEIHIEANGDTTKYRAYVNGTVDLLLNTLPDTMTGKEFASYFNANYGLVQKNQKLH
jgi:hypothetical protein